MKNDETRYQKKLHSNNKYYHVSTDKIKRNEKARAKYLLKKQEKEKEIELEQNNQLTQ